MDFERRGCNVLYSKIIRKTRKSGAETETKALLYLMNLRKDSDEINYFIVDFLMI